MRKCVFKDGGRINIKWKRGRVQPNILKLGTRCCILSLFPAVSLHLNQISRGNYFIDVLWNFSMHLTPNYFHLSVKLQVNWHSYIHEKLCVCEDRSWAELYRKGDRFLGSGSKRDLRYTRVYGYKMLRGKAHFTPKMVDRYWKPFNGRTHDGDAEQFLILYLYYVVFEYVFCSFCNIS